MKKGGFLLLSLFLFFLLADSAFSDEITENLQSILIEKFDNPNPDPEAKDERPWIVQASKFRTIVRDPNDPEKIVEEFPKVAYVASIAQALHREPPEGVTYRSLGIHGRFDRKADNFIELIPAKKAEDGSLVPNPILLPGRVKNMDIWIWGSNYDYYLEAHLLDYRGINHVMKFGSIKYKGWKNLRVNVPRGIPQAVVYAPNLKGLKLVKFVIWTKPGERVEDFRVYFDEFKIFTDMFESLFDGEDLANPKKIDQLWSETASN
ncbi:MAG: flagellar filament outer layer protein FlaA [Spirochaetales bacterium]|jgi:hypothetical protein|nr:flagellar filament outer layer protein FlaA [Spirochaetales bacterium]